MQGLFQRLNNFFFSRVDNPTPVQHHPEEPEISDELLSHYSFILGYVFSYFNDLPHESKIKFVKRVYQYKSNKKFHFVGIENKDDIAILVSASAVQVTFGLKNYMMSYFKDI